MLGRRKDVVATAVRKLTDEASAGYTGEVVGVPCDVTDAAAVDALWARLRDDGVVVDVLVLNMAKIAPKKPLLEAGTDEVWKNYDGNVRAQLQMTERFYKQEGKGASDTKVGEPLLFLASFRHFLAGDSINHLRSKKKTCVALACIYILTPNPAVSRPRLHRCYP